MKARGLVVLLTGTILSSNVFAVDTNGTCGTNCSWKIENDVLTVYPTVAGQQVVMDNYTNVQTGEEADVSVVRTAAPWGEAYQTVTSVVVADGIDRLSDRAFQGFRNVTSVSMPDSLTTIGNLAFDRMPSLTSVDIPDAVTSIGIAAFQFSGLTSVEIPSNVQTIGTNAFNINHSLESVTFATDENGHSSLTTIGDAAFQSTPLLTSIELPDSVISVGQFAFGQAYSLYPTNSLETIVLNEGLQEIGSTAFSRVNATSIVLPASLFEGDRELNPYLFAYSNITTIYCPEGNEKCMNYVAMTCDSNEDPTSEECISTTRPLEIQPTVNTYRQDANGNYIINGVRYSSYADMVKNKNAHPMRRIYTVEEAAKASKDTGNTIKLRYK